MHNTEEDTNWVTQDEIETALVELWLSGQDVEVHASLSSFGIVKGGAGTIVAALATVCRTVLVPTFTFEHCQVVTPPANDRPRQNALNYAEEDAEQRLPQTLPIDLLASPSCIDQDMGVIPRNLLRHPAAVRSRHPFQSFAAIGAHADLYLEEHPDEDPLLPLKKLCQHEGVVLLIGCGLDSCTAVHLAEELAGRKPFIRWYLSSDGMVRRVVLNSCSDGFVNLTKSVSHLSTSVTVGNSTLVSYPMKAFVEACANRIAADPAITLCDEHDGNGCDLCVDAVRGGPTG